MATDTIPLNKNLNDFDLSQALKLRLINKLSYGEIAKYMQAPKSTVYVNISTFLDKIVDAGSKDDFDIVEPLICRGLKMRYYHHMMNDDTVKASSANNAAYLVDKINNIQRLSEGQSTANLAIRSISADLNDLLDKLQVGETIPDQAITTPDNDDVLPPNEP